jgi:hypothetical protein
VESTLHLAVIGSELPTVFFDSVDWLFTAHVKDIFFRFPGVAVRKVVRYKQIAAPLPDEDGKLEAIRALPHLSSSPSTTYYELFPPVLTRMFPRFLKDVVLLSSEPKKVRLILDQVDWLFFRKRSVAWLGGLLLTPVVMKALREFLPPSKFRIRSIKRKAT